MISFARHARVLLVVLVCWHCTSRGETQPRASAMIAVTGRVVDEAGAPIADARVAVSSETYVRDPCVTRADGTFETRVPRTPALRLAASHPDFGAQWTDMLWSGWSRYDATTAEPVQLTLRRGVVLHGRLVDAHGRPRANEALLLVPAYVGSGPHTLDTRTDAEGRFVFPRAVLRDFELVARSLDDWHPETMHEAGDYLRIVPHTDAWLVDARADAPIEVVVEELTLVPVTLRILGASGAASARAEVALWLRGGPSGYLGSVPRTDARGRIETLMQRGVAYEVWVSRDHDDRTMPWTRSIAADWQGSVDGPTEMTLTIP